MVTPNSVTDIIPPLNGAVLIIGSLLWEDEGNALDKDQGRRRSQWRASSLDLSRIQHLKCPIRYGRRSDSRKKTFTMVFSNSCPALGSSAVAPLANTIDTSNNFTALFDIAVELARAEGIARDTQKRLCCSWGAVALALSPKFERDRSAVAQALKENWSKRFNDLQPDRFTIDQQLETPTINQQGLLTAPLDWTQFESTCDFILATVTAPNIAVYPSDTEIARAMRTAPDTYYTYFAQNIQHNIYTFQDTGIRKVLPIDIQAAIPIKPRKLRLEDYDPSFGRYYFTEDLISLLGNRIFQSSESAIAESILSILDYPVNASLDTSITSTLTHLDTYFSIGYDNFIENNLETPAAQLLSKCLHVNRLPVREKELIETQVVKDLKKRELNIAYYEELPAVKRFIQETKYPDSHEDGLLVDFYKRNAQEREKILRHFLFHIEDRAIYNATRIDKSIGITSIKDNSYYDRPYYSSIPRSENYFDHRKIDRSRHRIYQMNIPLMSANELMEYYDSDKSLFYEKLLKQCTSNEVFAHIDYAVSALGTLIERRKPLLIELKHLFESNQWIAFYGVALPQIEGIFSDMVAAIAPKKKFGSLLEKVEAARAAYTYASIYFDYFQYLIPLQRNRFMHTGADDITRQKCLDLLFDIRYLVLAFTELATPIVQVKKLINNRSIMDFADLDGFNRYFDLLDKIKETGQYEQIKPDIETFEKEYLSSQVSLDYFASYELPEQMEGDLERWAITVVEFPVDPAAKVTPINATSRDIKNNTENIQQVFEQILFHNYGQLDRLLSYKQFLDRCNAYIPSMSTTAVASFEKIRKDNDAEFAKLTILNSVLKNSLAVFRQQ